MRFLGTALFCLLCGQLCAQDLLNSPTSSRYNYIFRLDEAQAKTLYLQEEWETDLRYFRNLVDSLEEKELADLKLSPGHYLKARVIKDKLDLEVSTIQHYSVHILNNQADLAVQVYDTVGNIIPNAEVRIQNRRIRFDNKTLTYRLKKANKEGLLEVRYDGLTTWYELDKRYNNPKLGKIGGVVYGSTLRYVWRPVKFVVRAPVDAVVSLIRGYPTNTTRSIGRFFTRIYWKIGCLFDGYACDELYYYSRNEERFAYYVAFSKPIYRPRDTLRGKAYIVRQKGGRPIQKTLRLFLSTGNGNKEIATLEPYAKGGYSFELVLDDSLDLQLDRTYTFFLEDKKEQSIAEASFKYEDYELTESQLEVRIPTEEHYRGQALPIYIQATDENELNLPDARVTVLAELDQIQRFHQDSVFVNDTLFYQELPLKAQGETLVEVADSLFPAADLTYTLRVTMNTSDNERLEESSNPSYYYQKQEIIHRLSGDSIYFVLEENGVPTSAPAVELVANDRFGNAADAQTVALPYGMPINPIFSSYKLQLDEAIYMAKLQDEPSMLRCRARRTRDSVFIQVDNPRRLPFVYFIYCINREVARGYGTDLQFARAASSRQTYYVSLQYLWAGKIAEEDYEVPVRKDQLNIEINTPSLVTPGQRQQIEIQVRDYKGRPVPDVDLTAYGLTSKFKGYRPPSLPDAKPNYPRRKIINTFRIEKRHDYRDAYDKLPYELWNTIAQLDQLEYYRFLYPGDSIYTYAYFTEDSITQFAPFVSIEPVHVIQVDRIPVYFDWTNHEQPYAFRVDSGYHQLRLRTTDKVITIDSFYFEPGKKTILSLHDSLQLHNVQIEKAEPELSSVEKQSWYPYLLPYRPLEGPNFAFLRQGNGITLLEPHPLLNQRRFSRVGLLAGPVVPRIAELEVLEGFRTRFDVEPYFEYDFQPELLKMRSVDAEDRYPQKLLGNRIEPLRDSVLTVATVRRRWQLYKDLQRRGTPRYAFPTYTSAQNGELQLEFDTTILSLNVLLFKYDDPDFVRIYPGDYQHFHDLEAGDYQVLFFYAGGSYNILDSLTVHAGGLNFYRKQLPAILPKDRFSERISKLIESTLFQPKDDQEKQQLEQNTIREIYRERFSQRLPSGLRTIEGYVLDDQGEPLIGASILVKGTTVGTVTDLDGYYSITLPEGAGDLQVGYTGFATQEVPVTSTKRTNIILEASPAMLQEIVVIGYGPGRVQKDNVVAYGMAVSETDALIGRVAGVVITDADGFGIDKITVRGSRANPGLIFIDGEVYLGNYQDIDTTKIQSITILGSEEAVNLFGSQAAEGALLIQTKDGQYRPLAPDQLDPEIDPEESLPLRNGIRSNFRDYAYWQPQLRTDVHGKAAFEVTFPDDVTQWRTFVLAMKGKKRIGTVERSVKSFKPLMAQLSLPRFLVAGDTTQVIGKTLNYTQDTLQLRNTFTVNDQTLTAEEILVTDAQIDTLQLVADSTDSLTVQYALERTNGYMDGERRVIPVFPQGVALSKGQFYNLQKDTAFSVSFDQELGTVSLRAEANALDLIDHKVKWLIDYKYLCNEQMASIIKALLAEQRIRAFKGESFKQESKVRRLLRKLEDNQNPEGTWGWWNRSEGIDWITLHVLEAIYQARAMGYAVSIRVQGLADRLVWKLENTESGHQVIYLVRSLRQLEPKVNIKKYLERAARDSSLDLQDRFQLLELEQLAGLTIHTDALLQYRQQTIFGNSYFADTTSLPMYRHPYTGDLQLQLIAYRIVSRDSILAKTYLPSLQAYLFERDMNYNTYQTAQLVETVLPDLLKEDRLPQLPELQLSGALDTTVTQFPFTVALSPGEALRVTKSGDYPVFLSASQSYWENEPSRQEDYFVVKSSFKKGQDYLKAGEPVTLQVEVDVKQDAEYIMLEVPIPAGCSYADKQRGIFPEVHREYFKEKVSIFCRRLAPGKHHFELDLLPRYSGVYHLNPAKVALMYFPVFYGHNAGKVVHIGN